MTNVYGIAVALTAMQLGFMGLLIPYGWMEHYNGSISNAFRSGPYFLCAFGFLAVAWGTIWGRFWAIPVAAIVFLFVAYELCRSATTAKGPSGPWGLLGAIEILVLLVVFLLVLATQAASIGFVTWRWRYLRHALTWAGGLLEISEIAILIAMVPVIYHYDFTLPETLNAKDRATRAAAIAKIQNEDSHRKAAVKHATDHFISSVIESNLLEQQAAEAEFAQLQGNLFWGDIKAIEDHPNARVQEEFVALAHRLNLGSVSEIFLKVAADPKRDRECRRLALDCLLGSTKDRFGANRYYVGPDNDEAIPLILSMLKDDPTAPPEMQIRAIEALGRFAIRYDGQKQMPRVVKELEFIAKTNGDEPIRTAAREAAEKIKKGQNLKD